MHRVVRFILFAIALLVLVGGILAAVLPVRFVWSGDGVARAYDGKTVTDDRTALIGTRTRTLFGLREQFSYDVQQIDLGNGSYVRFSGCVVRNSRPGGCTGSNGIAYKIRVIKRPAYDQFSDDDGVDVGN